MQEIKYMEYFLEIKIEILAICTINAVKQYFKKGNFHSPELFLIAPLFFLNY